MKDLNLDIPLPENLFPVLRNWEPPEWLAQTPNTTYQCRECKGGKMIIVHSAQMNTNVLKYCFACKGIGRIRI